MIESIQSGAGFLATMTEPVQRETAKDGAANALASPVDTATISESAGQRAACPQISDMTGEEADTALSFVRQSLAGQDATFPHDGLTPERVMQLIGLVA
jgi:hypothetical protein